MFRPMYSKKVFAIPTPFGFISVFRLTRNYSMLSLFIQCHWRYVIIRNCTVWPNLFLLNVFTAIKGGTHFNLLCIRIFYSDKYRSILLSRVNDIIVLLFIPGGNTIKIKIWSDHNCRSSSCDIDVSIFTGVQCRIISVVIFGIFEIITWRPCMPFLKC